MFRFWAAILSSALELADPDWPEFATETTGVTPVFIEMEAGGGFANAGSTADFFPSPEPSVLGAEGVVIPIGPVLPGVEVVALAMAFFWLGLLNGLRKLAACASKSCRCLACWALIKDCGPEPGC